MPGSRVASSGWTRCKLQAPDRHARQSPGAGAGARGAARLEAASRRRPSQAVEIASSRPSGDRIQDRPLSEVGGKGLFTKEIEEALLARSIDLAVHSMKDMPTRAAGRPGDRPAILPREDVRDAFISRRRQVARRPAAGRGGRHVVAAAAGAGAAPAARSRRRAPARQCRDAPAQARRGRGAMRRCWRCAGLEAAGAGRVASPRRSRPTRCCRPWRRAPSASRPAPAIPRRAMLLPLHHADTALVSLPSAPFSHARRLLPHAHRSAGDLVRRPARVSRRNLRRRRQYQPWSPAQWCTGRCRPDGTRRRRRGLGGGRRRFPDQDHQPNMNERTGATSANALHHRPFVCYWLALWAASFAVQILSVSVGWQVYDITRNPLDLGLIGLVQFLPPLLLVLVTGLAADRSTAAPSWAHAWPLRPPLRAGAAEFSRWTRPGQSSGRCLRCWPCSAPRAPS